MLKRVDILLPDRKSHACGGVMAYSRNLGKALALHGFAPRFIYSVKEIDAPDFLIMASLGDTGDLAPNEKRRVHRAETIQALKGEVPVVMVRHSVITGRGVFNNSRQLFEDFEFDLIVSVEDTEDMKVCLEVDHKFNRVAFIPHPYLFREELFADRSAVGKVVLSSARIDSPKKTAWILEMLKVERLREAKKFIMSGAESGVYWFRAIKPHPMYLKAEWLGAHTQDDYPELHARAGFVIDLSWLACRRTGLLSGGRTQYTTLQAVECGNVPVGFEVWRSPSYDGVWLPNPTKKGAGFKFDAEASAEILASAEYDFELAQQNLRVAKEIHDIGRIGALWAEALRSI